MVTVEQIFVYIEKIIAEAYMAGNKAVLSRSQSACHVLMDAANDAGDRESAARFRVLAAKAANYIEELAG